MTFCHWKRSPFYSELDFKTPVKIFNRKIIHNDDVRSIIIPWIEIFFLKGTPEITRAVHIFNRSYSKILLREGTKYEASNLQQVLTSFMLH